MPTNTEIAERAAREILNATWRYTHQDESGEIWQDAVKSSAAVKSIILRAIEESGQQEPSNRASKPVGGDDHTRELREAFQELRTDILSSTGTRTMTDTELKAVRSIERVLAQGEPRR